MSCDNCPDSGPEVNNDAIPCDGEFYSTDCIVTSKANSCFKFGLNTSLTNVIDKICKYFKNHETRITDLENGIIEGCCIDSSILEVAGSQLNLDLYLGDLKSLPTQQTYTTDYSVDRFSYRVQPDANLLRVEYTYRISITETSLSNFSAIYVIAVHDISNINTYLQTNFNKVVSAPHTNPFPKPASVFVTPIEEVISKTFSSYTDLTSITGVTDDQIVDVFRVESLAGASSKIKVGATIYLPIEDI